jgi:hypothetical protein
MQAFAICTLISACGGPQYRTAWEPYKQTSYPVDVTNQLCESEWVAADLKAEEAYRANLAAAKQKKEKTNVCVGHNCSAGGGLGGNWEANTTLTDGMNTDLAGIEARNAGFNACMLKTGFHKVSTCVAEC